MPTEPTGEKKPGRIARQLSIANQIRREPGSVVGLLRGWLLGLWQAKGGGFYGLGVVITFIILEVRMFVDDVGGGDSMSEMIAQQAVEFVFRFGILSFINGILAVLWPAFLLSWTGAWGILLLVAGYFLFERGLRPVVETWFPELRETRILRARRKQEKKEQKRIRKTRKGSG